MTSIWRGVFFPIDRKLVAMALNQALSKWSVTIVTLRPCGFTNSVIFLHWATLLSFAKQLIPLDNFETKLHNDKYTTVLFHHDVLRCLGAKWASGHQQPPYWLFNSIHYGDVKMTAMASRNTGQSSVCSTVCSDWQQKQQRSALLSLCDEKPIWQVVSRTKGQ